MTVTDSETPAVNKGIVTAGHSKTADAAAQILHAGGNAFDAAIAALYTVCVTEPALASLGGGGFLMASPSCGPPILFDFFVHTPRQRKSAKEISTEEFICDFGDTQQAFIIGSGTSAVPGCVKGIFEVARRYSKMPMKDLIEPTLQTLKEGVEINEMQAHVLKILTPIYLSGAAGAIFESAIKPGCTVQSGERIHFPKYDDLLESLVVEGEDLFYRGEIAKSVHDISREGGQVTYDDMVNYRVELREPLQVRYGGHRLLLNPPPSSGGIIIGLAMSHLASCHLAQHRFGSSEHLSVVIDTLARCARLEEGASPDAEARFDPRLLDIYRANREWLAPNGTTHISIIDRDGNAVAVSISNGEGCGTLIPGTSVMLNNMMGEHDVNPHGLTEWPPARRLSSLMSPTVVISDDGSQIAVGTGGSNRIPAVVQQVLINLLDFDMSVKDAVQAPRVHYHRQATFAEDAFGNPELSVILQRYGEATVFRKNDIFFGGAHTARHCGRTVEGFGDTRRGGVWMEVS